LYNAVAMVDVALKTSMITTILSDTSYISSSLGERMVYKVGFALMGCKYTVNLKPV